MDEHKKIYRVFQLIARLRAPLGAAKAELADYFDVNVRTIERYFKLLKELGFEVEKIAGQTPGRYKIEKITSANIKPEDLIVFTLEEAAAVKDALLATGVKGPLKKTLLDKLYALTDLDELSDALYRQSVSKNISDIRFAIKHQHQVILKGYQSVNTQEVCDRVIEPIRFHSYYRYLLAWEVKSGMIKQYKTERIAHTELTRIPFRFRDEHKQLKIDVFGMSGSKPIPVKLYLSRRARMLMEEEFEGASLYLKTSKGMDCFDGEVYSLEGVGRFVLGLVDEVEVTAPKALKEYVRKKVNLAQLGRD